MSVFAACKVVGIHVLHYLSNEGKGMFELCDVTHSVIKLVFLTIPKKWVIGSTWAVQARVQWIDGVHRRKVNQNIDFFGGVKIMNIEGKTLDYCLD